MVFSDFVLLKIFCDFDDCEDDVDWTEWVGAALLMTPTDLDQYAQIQKVKSWNYWAGDLKMI